MKSILVSGATGFIGSTFVKKIQTEGHRIFCVVRDAAKAPQGTTPISYDGSYEALARSLGSEKIDAVVHLATLFRSQHKSEEISDLIQSNLTFGTHLLEWMSKSSVHQFINVGTYAQYMDGKSEKPQNLYSATKTAFEKILDYYQEAFSLKVLNLYLYDSYGPSDPRPKLLNLILKAIQKEETLKMSPGLQEICYVYVQDVAEALSVSLQQVESINAGKKKQFCVHSNFPINVRELADIAQKVVGKKMTPEFGGYPYRPREIMKFAPPYPILPGWQPKVSLEDGIKIIWKELNHEHH